MATGAGLLKRARQHIGEKYVNVCIPKNDSEWDGPWDCAEFMSWLVYQEAGILYGCTDNNADPSIADAYTGAWARDSEDRGIRVPVEQAAATIGGILLRYPPAPGKMGHIVICDGQGGTVEAMGRSYGVVKGTVRGRRWDTGVLVPGINYDAAAAPLDIAPPSHLYRIGAPNMARAVIIRIQEALVAKGFDPGPIDGDFGPKTMTAVTAFQEEAGLVVDGEIGETTAKALGIALIGTVSAAGDEAEQGESMTPLIAIAASVLPDIIKTIAGDKAGTIVNTVSKAVSDATGTTDPVVAREKISSDRTIATALQVRLAEIAVEQEEKRQQAQLATLKLHQDEEARRRDDEIKALKVQLEDVQNARASASEWANSGGPMAWGAPAVSVIVTLGFFGILLLLITNGLPNRENSQDQSVFQIINITIGALAAAFATVVSFWLGSSQGSRLKDVATIEQAKQTNDIIKTQVTTAEVAREAASAERSARDRTVSAGKPSNFQRCVDIVLGHEGGFSAHRADPGGATQFGITIGVLKEWRNNDGLTADDVRALGREEACEIYRTRYWNVLRCDDLPVGVDLTVFDFGVNAGPQRSAKMLQRIVGAEADGSIGPATLAAVKVAPPRDVVTRMAQQRLAYYRELGTWETFGRGWTNRTNAVEQAALEMAGPATAVA